MRTKRRITDSDLAAARRLSKLWDAYQERNKDATQEVAGAKIGLSQAAFSQYLKGTIPLNARATLKFAQLLGVHPTEIRPELEPLLKGVDLSTISQDAVTVGKVFDALPDCAKQETLDILLYKVDRSKTFLIKDTATTADYLKKIESIKSDLERRQAKKKIKQ